MFFNSTGAPSFRSSYNDVPSGYVTALVARDGCPYLDDYDENEIDKVNTAAFALADSNPVCHSGMGPMLKIRWSIDQHGGMLQFAGITPEGPYG